MGSGRDKRKKTKAKVPGAGADKTAKKTELNELKVQRRAMKKEGDDDLDVLLAQFKLEDKQRTEVTVDEGVPTPSPRVFASFISVLAQKEEQILLFGGEFYDNTQDRMSTYNDLYFYNPGNDTWSQIHIPKGPSPRSGQQAVYHKGYVYMYGGELTSSNMEKFRHFKELWRLDVATKTWEELPGRGGPSARSGHRMAIWKNRLIVFGGFEDTGKRTKYYNDTWFYNIEELKWVSVGSSDTTAPAPRGGCQIAVHGDTLFVFGGHSVLIDDRGEEKDKLHDDIWSLNLNSHKWEKVKKEGMAPGPRMSFGLVVHKKRAIVFGGVTDTAGRGDRVYSEQHNELYQYNLELKRWFPVALRVCHPPKTDASPREEELSDDKEAVSLGSGKLDKDSVLYKAAVRIQSRYRGYVIRKAYKTYKLGGKISELLYSPAAYGIDLSSQHILKPRARANPMMTVYGNTLVLMGGIVEVESKDVTLDDVWKLDLVKLDGWTCVRENSVGQDLVSDDEWGSDDEDNEDADDNDKDS
eukprot:jgi/Botrbrau1/17815/Bobra.0127s0060.1